MKIDYFHGRAWCLYACGARWFREHGRGSSADRATAMNATAFMLTRLSSGGENDRVDLKSSRYSVSFSSTFYLNTGKAEDRKRESFILGQDLNSTRVPDFQRSAILLHYMANRIPL